MTNEEKYNIIVKHYADASIDYEEIEDVLRKIYRNGFECGYTKAKRPIQGGWITVSTNMICAECGETFNYARWNYCPNCGAHMTDEDET